MSITDRVRKSVLEFLRIQPAQEVRIDLRETVGFAANVIRNRVWYRGDPSELSQLAKQLDGRTYGDATGTRFWAQVPEIGPVRKAHAGLPAVMVDTLAAVVKADLDAFDFGGDNACKSRWEEMAGPEENNFSELVGHAIAETLVSADGAFKISIDTEVSEHPLLEFWPADRVEYEMRRGRIAAVLFVSVYRGERGQAFTLKERYARGGITYELYNEAGDPCELSECPALEKLEPITFTGDFMLAVPLRFFSSNRFPGRGRSIFDNKTDAFDALDEVVSQWIDAIRAGRVKRYIPDDLVPRGTDGTTTPLSYFQDNFVITDHSAKEGAQSKLEMQQAEIRYDAFTASYAAALDMCLQGIMSPATLGINLGKTASAEAQRERKDVTGFTRGAITDALEKVLPRVVVTMLRADDLINSESAGAYKLPSISFGEYGAPDFDSRVETVSKARSAGIMSLEAAVEELWGASKSEEEQAAEVARLKAEAGVTEEEEPLVAAIASTADEMERPEAADTAPADA